MTNQRRLIAGGTAIAAGLWFLAGAAAAPTLPKDTYKKVVEADIAQLQKHIDHIVANYETTPVEANRYGPTTRGLTMMLAMCADATGDAALQTEALKLADMLGKKDWKAAAEQAKKLKANPGGAPLKTANLHAKSKFALDEVMSPYRSGTVGGLNIEKDIRAIRDGKVPFNAAAIELIGARASILSEYAIHFPCDTALVSKAKTEEWVKMCKESMELSGKLSAEAAKGKAANEKNIVMMVKALDAKCAACHKEFRDSE